MPYSKGHTTRPIGYGSIPMTRKEQDLTPNEKFRHDLDKFYTKKIQYKESVPTKTSNAIAVPTGSSEYNLENFWKNGKKIYRFAKKYGPLVKDVLGDTVNSIAQLAGYGSYRAVKWGGGRRRRNYIRMGNQAPKIINSNGRFIITHEEYLGDVFSSQAFINNGFALNPGITLEEGGFTNWLPNIAENFEQWKPQGIVFTFKSLSADSVVGVSANPALGSVTMATDYNVQNTAFGSKVQMENYEHSVSCKPSSNMNHYVECAKSQTPVKELYTRSGAVPAGADARLYDLGLFQIATAGQQTNGGQLGELWVSYTIELLKPRILPGTGGNFQSSGVTDHFQIYNLSVLTPGVLPATPFGTSQTPLYPTSQSTLGGIVCGGICPAANFAPQPEPTGSNFVGGIPQLNASGQPTGVLGSSTANTYYFPPGITQGIYQLTYLADYSITGGGVTSSATLTNLINANLIAAAGVADSQFTFNNVFSSNLNYGISQTFFFNVTAANASIELSFTATMNTPIFAEFFVSYIGAQMN